MQACIPLALLCAMGLWAPEAGAVQAVSNPWLGITRITDSLSLPAPADQTTGSNLGAHTANVNVVLIDLTAAGIGFKLSPDNGAAAGETTTQQTLSFMSQEGAKLAVNTHFFNFTTNAAVGTTLTGFAASNGTVVSAFEPAPLANTLLPYALTANAPGINISASNQAQIVNAGATSTTLANGVVPYNTIAGSDQVVFNGVKSLPAVVTTVTGPHQIVAKTVPPFGNPALGNWYTDQIAARTAMGLSQDNKTLILFTADAAGGSNGMTVSEEVDYLLAGGFGVYNLLNLDGGGSTTLAMKNPLTGVDSVVNASSGGPRFVGASLAVFASPVPEPGMGILMALGAVALGGRLRRGVRA
jgi:hypothetical protein